MNSLRCSLPTTFYSGPKQDKTHQIDQEYIVLDSQNQDEEVGRVRKLSMGGFFQVERSYQSVKENQLSVEYQDRIQLDRDIQESKLEAQNLQKQCQLLEKLLADMMVEQAQIQVKIDTRKRKKGLGKMEGRTNRPCPVHNPCSSHQKQTYSSFASKYLVEPKTCEEEVPSTYVTSTPMISRNEYSLLDRNMSKVKISEVKRMLDKGTKRHKKSNGRRKASKNKENMAETKVKESTCASKPPSRRKV